MSLGLGTQKPEKDKPGPIIIKFRRYNVRVQTFRNKRKLKGKRISVTESLIKTRMKQLQNATEGHSFWNARSNGGNILYVDVNNHYRVKVFYGYFSQIMA